MIRRQDTIDRLLTGVAAGMSVAFLLRALGQVPQAWLPPISEWQGSAIPYPILLGTQIVILGILAFMLTRRARGQRVIGRRTSRVIMGVGTVYFAAMTVRLLMGMLMWMLWLPESAWFMAWISTVFHLVLASIMLIWGWHQLHISHSGGAFVSD